ncbi:DgyrCDS14478 [Dimorphilus gyrociliatus]|uniref:DgyrCDS14478 n=1 Tax=Dimorphilus gyrociliatus TaxID=2664684 RepID=A0A7I8WDR1_9ANNE|nr:DgyrCDS14478 [Dimorphilus gyrociliatus]
MLKENQIWTFERNEFENDNLQSMVEKYAIDNTILLAITDKGYLELALNFYKFSIEKHSIKNFLFVCIQKVTHQRLNKLKIPNVLYMNDNRGNEESLYGSSDYKWKTHVKTKVILDVLRMGYQVVITDVDIAFLKNPLKEFQCPQCDIEATMDGHNIYNSGFYLSRPTQASISLHKKMLSGPRRNSSNQILMNNIARSMTQASEIKIMELTVDKWPYGLLYFNRHPWFSEKNKCNKCIIIHNNRITSSQAKIYRFKEHLMWYVDENGEFFYETKQYLGIAKCINYCQDTE